MYEALQKEGRLPKGDQEELPFSCTCLVGQTRVLDPREIPIVAEEKCHVVSVLSDGRPFTVSPSFFILLALAAKYIVRQR